MTFGADVRKEVGRITEAWFFGANRAVKQLRRHACGKRKHNNRIGNNKRSSVR